jgi:peptidoglycan/xylan/chitin deacetylase (PgdA/CDA1 family)
MFMRKALLLLLQFVLVLTSVAQGQTHAVALTFDDLPLAYAGSEGTNPGERIAEARAVNQAILAGLKRHHAWAIGFVNEKNVVANDAGEENRKILRQWIGNGNDLGNHTFSHADLSKISAAEFEQEVLDGEVSIKPLMAEKGQPLRFLRFPFNHTGETVEKQRAVADFLKQHGYEVATCTIDNSDYVFARAYGVMLRRHDADSARRLRSDYLAFTTKLIDYYSRLDQQVFGREIPHVMLLHASRLNADTVDKILAIFEDMRYRFVTLAEAQSDSAYKTPDTFVTSYGPMWGYRWARELHVAVDGKLEPEVPAWVTDYGKP